MQEGLTTERLILRRWKDSDRIPFARLNSDPRVMEFLPRCLGREESDQLIERIERHFLLHHFGLYAVELGADYTFVGYIGLSIPSFDAPFMPAVEVGWRLAYEHWGKGLATEGAREVIRYAFERVGLEGVVSFTPPANKRSIRVMEKLGMMRDPGGDFEHPKLEPGHRLRTHLLFRISRTRWIENCPRVA